VPRSGDAPFCEGRVLRDPYEDDGDVLLDDEEVRQQFLSG